MPCSAFSGMPLMPITEVEADFFGQPLALKPSPRDLAEAQHEQEIAGTVGSWGEEVLSTLQPGAEMAGEVYQETEEGEEVVVPETRRRGPLAVAGQVLVSTAGVSFFF
jgi:hypothetical protein